MSMVGDRLQPNLSQPFHSCVNLGRLVRASVSSLSDVVFNLNVLLLLLLLVLNSISKHMISMVLIVQNFVL